MCITEASACLCGIKTWEITTFRESGDQKYFGASHHHIVIHYCSWGSDYTDYHLLSYYIVLSASMANGEKGNFEQAKIRNRVVRGSLKKKCVMLVWSCGLMRSPQKEEMGLQVGRR